ncbi:hypothetical protein NVV95_03210 [Herbiconiux sp. CPCC 205716]|uniref:Uncharacterized protein n=1 Tax=Herbiconiux gentiana TaxID=2970912 RepID=A0ABT2GBH4_9MICO|nr:hypothetical protein [Herbiconiux gentiana]MCS5713560.1 hypothetical protein [Herbiconiux gentiana]
MAERPHRRLDARDQLVAPSTLGQQPGAAEQLTTETAEMAAGSRSAASQFSTTGDGR